MTHHIRYSPRYYVPHYVNTRTVLTLCGVNAQDWALSSKINSQPTCEKCLKQSQKEVSSERTSKPMDEGSRNDIERPVVTAVTSGAGDTSVGTQSAISGGAGGNRNAAVERNPAPWSQENELSVIRDAVGDIVSFQEESQRIINDVNFKQAAVVLLDRLASNIAQATGPNATAADTQRLAASGRMALALAQVGRKRT